MTLTHVPVTPGRDDSVAVDSSLAIHRRRRRRWPAALAGAVAALVLAVVGLSQVTAPALSFDGQPRRGAPPRMT